MSYNARLANGGSVQQIREDMEKIAPPREVENPVTKEMEATNTVPGTREGYASKVLKNIDTVEANPEIFQDANYEDLSGVKKAYSGVKSSLNAIINTNGKGCFTNFSPKLSLTSLVKGRYAPKYEHELNPETGDIEAIAPPPVRPSVEDFPLDRKSIGTCKGQTDRTHPEHDNKECPSCGDCGFFRDQLSNHITGLTNGSPSDTHVHIKNILTTLYHWRKHALSRGWNNETNYEGGKYEQCATGHEGFADSLWGIRNALSRGYHAHGLHSDEKGNH